MQPIFVFWFFVFWNFAKFVYLIFLCRIFRAFYIKDHVIYSQITCPFPIWMSFLYFSFPNSELFLKEIQIVFFLKV